VSERFELTEYRSLFPGSRDRPRPFPSAQRRLPLGTAMIVVGPEGGWTPEEVAAGVTAAASSHSVSERCAPT